MQNTNFRKVIDRAYITYLKDYHLDNLLNKDENTFYDYLGGFLINAIDSFEGDCLHSLSYHEELRLKNDTLEEYTEYVFDEELSNKEEMILALYIAINWLQKEINDVLIFKPKIQAKEFKNMQYNIDRMNNQLYGLEEKVSSQITKYQLGKIPSGMSYFEGGGNNA